VGRRRRQAGRQEKEKGGSQQKLRDPAKGREGGGLSKIPAAGRNGCFIAGRAS